MCYLKKDEKLKIGCSVHWWKIEDGESRRLNVGSTMQIDTIVYKQ